LKHNGVPEVRMNDKRIPNYVLLIKVIPEVGMIDRAVRVARLYRLYTNIYDRHWRCYVRASDEGFSGKKSEI
jgi:hypothetical protein